MKKKTILSSVIAGALYYCSCVSGMTTTLMNAKNAAQDVVKPLKIAVSELTTESYDHMRNSESLINDFNEQFQKLSNDYDVKNPFTQNCKDDISRFMANNNNPTKTIVDVCGVFDALIYRKIVPSLEDKFDQKEQADKFEKLQQEYENDLAILEGIKAQINLYKGIITSLKTQMTEKEKEVAALKKALKPRRGSAIFKKNKLEK